MLELFYDLNDSNIILPILRAAFRFTIELTLTCGKDIVKLNLYGTGESDQSRGEAFPGPDSGAGDGWLRRAAERTHPRTFSDRNTGPAYSDGNIRADDNDDPGADRDAHPA